MKRTLYLLATLTLIGCGGKDDDDYPNKTDSGLKYKEIREGDGETAKVGDMVAVHYTGWLASNGKKFETSLNGEPIRFSLGLGQVIKGWDEGIDGMKVGGKRKLYIPADLGYGSQANREIPANSDLVFEVELVKILPKVKVKIQDLKKGSGREAKAGDTVSVHYTGWLTNGTKFDSSYDRNEPFDVTIGRSAVIQGWHDGLTGMKVGGKRKLTIPYQLAYGEQGRPPKIPGRAELIFEVEIVSMKNP